MDAKERAVELFQQGYNCAQAVVMAYADELNMDPEVLARAAVGFGGGVGRMREVCGAVSGMTMAIGLKHGTGSPDSRNDVYPMIQDVCASYKEANGSIVCRELLAGTGASKGGKPEERTPEYYKKRPCTALVAMAAELAGKYME